MKSVPQLFLKMAERRIIIGALLLLASLVVITALYATSRVDRAAQGRVLSDLSVLQPMRVALVLGCSPRLKDGRRNPFFESRMDAAATLLKSGKVERLLLSGDNHIVGYDEPTWMREALLSRGADPSALVLDYAGFSTFDSMVRARDVFGLNQFTIVTQERHAKRAVFLAEQLGLRTQAFAAQSIGGGFGVREKARELLARVRALLDTTLFPRRPGFLGPRIEIACLSHRLPLSTLSSMPT